MSFPLDRMQIVRLFILLVLPFILGAYLLPHTQYMTGQDLGAPGASSGNTTLSTTYAFMHTEEETAIQQKISTIFPLASYLDFQPFIYHKDPAICFSDQGSFLKYSDGAISPLDYNWTVLMPQQPPITVRPYSTSCAPIVIGAQSSYRWNLKIGDVGTIPPNATNATFVPQTTAYTRLTMDYGVLQGFVLIPVAFLFIWYPLAGIKKKIEKGLMEQ